MKKNVFYTSLFFFLFILSNYVFAAEGCTGSNCLANPLGNAQITDIIQKIISFLIKIGAPILAAMVIYGGFLILTAGDSPEKVKKGKDVILWAVVGYVIILCSWGVIAIIGQITGAKI